MYELFYDFMMTHYKIFSYIYYSVKTVPFIENIMLLSFIKKISVQFRKQNHMDFFFPLIITHETSHIIFMAVLYFRLHVYSI